MQRWHGYSWSPRIGRALTRRLEKRSGELMAILDSASHEEEGRQVPPPYPRDAAARNVKSYIDWRHKPPHSAYVRLEDRLIADIVATLCFAGAFLRDVNRASSDSQVVKQLNCLLRQNGHLHKAVWETDPNTRGFLGHFLPEGRQILDTGEHTEAELLNAVESALSVLGKPRRGRPKGSIDYASRLLGQRLAYIFTSYRGEHPTRRIDPVTGQLYGPFKDFVETVVSVVPRRLFKYKSAPDSEITKSVDMIVRYGVDPGHRVWPMPRAATE